MYTPSPAIEVIVVDDFRPMALIGRNGRSAYRGS